MIQIFKLINIPAMKRDFVICLKSINLEKKSDFYESVLLLNYFLKDYIIFKKENFIPNDHD
jgi:hypothetical protein